MGRNYGLIAAPAVGGLVGYRFNPYLAGEASTTDIEAVGEGIELGFSTDGKIETKGFAISLLGIWHVSRPSSSTPGSATTSGT